MRRPIAASRATHSCLDAAPTNARNGCGCSARGGRDERRRRWTGTRRSEIARRNGIKDPVAHYTATGIAVGVVFGVAVGTAMDNVGTGLAVGLALGVAIGASTGARIKKRRDAGGADD